MADKTCTHSALRIAGSVRNGLRKICLICDTVIEEIPLARFMSKDMVVLYQLNKRKRYYEKANMFIREGFAKSRDEALEKIKFIQFFEQELDIHYTKKVKKKRRVKGGIKYAKLRKKQTNR